VEKGVSREPPDRCPEECGRLRALLIDLDGVVYEGDRLVPGAPQALRWLDEQRIPHMFVTNTTSRSRRGVVAKLARLGVDVESPSILMPSVAATRWLRQHVDRPIALFVPPDAREDFGDFTLREEGPVAAVVVGDYGERWTFAELNRAFRLLMAEPQPKLLALGMTRYWLAADGFFRLDAGPFVAALAYAASVEPIVMGKPAAAFFEAGLQHLGAALEDAAVIGDDVRVDVGAAQSLGMRGILVKTGKFLSSDLLLGPDVVLESIAELPARWPELARAR
jgi:phospholysine phosphohistidine inorganic pyrophosphate phosphatase